MKCIGKNPYFRKENASAATRRHGPAGVVALLLAASLAACGGGGGSSANGDGGGGGDDGGNSPSVFSVTSTTPDEGESGVELDVTLTANFNRDLLASSVSRIELEKSSGTGSVGVPVSVSVDTASSVNIQPDAPLDILSEYTATATTDIADSRGNPLSEAFSWRFVTRDGDWQKESLIGEGEQPDVAADPMGNIWMVWLEEHFHHGTIEVAGRYYNATDGSNGPRLAFRSDVLSDADMPRIAVDRAGNAIVAWIQNDAVYARHWEAGSAVDVNGWSAVEKISGSAPVYSGARGAALHIEFRSINSARAVWIEQGSDGPVLASNNYWAPNGDWNGPLSGPELDVERLRSPFSDFAVDNNGNAAVIWISEEEPTLAEADNRVYVARYDAESNNWINTPIETDPHLMKGEAQEPRIVFDNEGNAFAAWWRESDDFSGRVYVSRYDADSGAWSDSTRIMGARHDSGGRFPSLAVDPEGNAMVTFELGELYVASYRADGEEWSDAQQIGDYAGIAKSEIAFDGDGNATVIWTKREGTATNLFANRYAAATDSWGTEKRIEKGGGGSAQRPVIDSLWEGGAVIVWEDTGYVYTNHFSAE